MGSIYLRKYGAGTTVDFNLYKLDGTGLKIDAASAAGDVTLYRDEAGVETLDADAFVDEGAIYSLALSAAEMTAARIMVVILDLSDPQVWLDKTLIIETYGNASAQHAFDLDLATQPVNLTQMGGVAQSATDLKDFADAGYDPATDKITGVKLCDKTTLVDGVTLCAQTTLVDGVTLCDQTTLVDGVTLCDRTTLVDGVTLCDLTTTTTTATTATNLTTNNDKAGYALSAAGVDAVLDEVVDANAPANANSLRETVNVIAAAVAGKLSGGGTVNRVFRALGDNKDRITAVVDANYNRTTSTPDGTQLVEVDGYWGEGYYGEGFWGEGFWGEYGAPIAPPFVPPQSATDRITRRPRRKLPPLPTIWDDTEFLELLTEFIEVI